MSTLISRGFGALQRIITRGFFSGAPPSPDCIVAFIGTITPPLDDAIGFKGTIYPLIAFNGIIVDNDLGFIGTIYDTKAFTGDICDDCDC